MLAPTPIVMIALHAAGGVLASPLGRHDDVVGRSSSAAAFTGDITYYQPGLGACGETSSGGEAVVAVSPAQFEGSCGRSVTIARGARRASARVVDKCPACAAGAIDVSPPVFRLLADLSVGRTTVSWSFD
ncbi:putative riboflavin-aldehyde forming enzyme protein [Rosellinia necatrix]|uniref:Putative riboflavin-aldehyde forming enzyme protein n=1 Tax=Rosellinia necatrix TaxID=77044 RepID=A0A1S7UMV3_ROSNE|nr:putative riboflavin-aldehyde forming enzyme protein [Rosellinia necatrix]